MNHPNSALSSPETAEQRFALLLAELGQIADVNATMELLSWDQETQMPPLGAQLRAEQLATLSRLAHQMFTSPSIAEHLALLSDYEDQQDPNSFEARLIQVTRRDYLLATRLPADFVEAESRAHNAAHHAWIEAREKSDFAIFAPALTRVIELARQKADFLGYQEHPYDALLDIYEPGARVADIQRMFADLREQTLPLLQAIAQQNQPDTGFLQRSVAPDIQRAFALKVAQDLGLQPEFSRLDTSAHPFATGNGNDVRITTRFNPQFFPTALFGVWHETGHALYEYGVDPQFSRTPLGTGTSLGVHESQSRLVENLICRSKAFWQHYYPNLQTAFGLEDVALEQFYRGINQIEPDLIRVEANEITYNFHVMLRFELEVALLEGSLSVEDLPAAWNQKMHSYLGLTPANDAEGVLQDVHWSAGLVGYFPTYTLGNLLSAQLWESLQAELGDVEALLAAGNFAPIMSWLQSHVHVHGRSRLPHEIAYQATGKALSAHAYVRYLWNKYRDIYQLPAELPAK